MSRVTARRPVVRLSERGRVARPDTLAAEEPLEIRVDGRALAVTMRTPGDDMDLAAGFLVSEGVVTRPEHLLSMRFCEGATRSPDGADGVNTYNVLDLTLAPGVAAPAPSVERSFYTTSSCGVCGKASLDAVRTTTAYAVADDPLTVSFSTLTQLPNRLRERQKVFEKTGGLHGAALFTADGDLLAVREDVGRHNAVDKLVGWALREDLLPLREKILVVSGRASFELTQKAWMAGIPMLAAVSAPSSLAVDLAEEAGMTLVAFLRDDRMNVYAGEQRVVAEAAA